jgi:hypothetical protein
LAVSSFFSSWAKAKGASMARARITRRFIGWCVG